MRIILFLFVLLTIGGCTRHPSEVVLTESNPISLNWVSPNVEVNVTQMLFGVREDQEFSFQSRLMADASSMELVLVDSFGNRALSLIWNIDGIVAKRGALLPEFVKAEHILKDIILVYWPAEVIPDVLNKSVEVAEKGEGSRSVIIDGADRYKIVYQSSRLHAWDEIVTLKNHALSYSLTIQSREVSI